MRRELGMLVRSQDKMQPRGSLEILTEMTNEMKNDFPKQINPYE